MSVDLKPAKRIRDPQVFKDFHATTRRCLRCSDPDAQAHHLLSRGRDDVMANLIPLCAGCHGVLHGASSYVSSIASPSPLQRIDAESVKRAIGRYLTSPEGFPATLYLTAKLGIEGSRVFGESFGVEL